ncbi:MAG: nickel pincer cofactor biosynthesis protein LarB [Clostridia bacterium]|nr:nickel pincer cofactor biosynthesis protein LarB [Clostridia bacterium]
MDIKDILLKVKSGELPLEEAEIMLGGQEYEDIGVAKIDFSRTKRRGFGEVVFCQQKAKEHLLSIYEAYKARGINVLGTRASEDQYNYVHSSVPEVIYDPVSRILKYEPSPVQRYGLVAVCTGGTADIPVAEEAAQTAEFHGATVLRVYDVGVAGIHRLLSNIEDIRKANCIIAVAGMEGALGGVITGLVDKPVIAVPTSVGYGTGLGGIAPLLSMLNSCSEGMTVVNIDNGFGAGYAAAQINRLITKGSKQ